MTQLTVPPSIIQNIARAKSLIRRDEPTRGLEALLSALALFEPAKTVGKARSVVEVNLRECVADINTNARIKTLLLGLTGSSTVNVPYKPGDEGKLAALLTIIHKALVEADATIARDAEESVKMQKETLRAKAKDLLAAGELPKAKATLRKLTEQFGVEPGILAYAGSLLASFGLHADAAEYLEQAVEAFPKAPEAYSDLVACYIDLREYAKAETVYKNVIKAFGKHPRTLVNLGKLYLAWNKRDKAFEVLNEAVRLDPSNKEAVELFAKVDC